MNLFGHTISLGRKIISLGGILTLLSLTMLPAHADVPPGQVSFCYMNLDGPDAYGHGSQSLQSQYGELIGSLRAAAAHSYRNNVSILLTRPPICSFTAARCTSLLATRFSPALFPILTMRALLSGSLSRYFRSALPIQRPEWRSMLREISTSAIAVRTRFMSSTSITVLNPAQPGRRCLTIRSFSSTWGTDHKMACFLLGRAPSPHSSGR